MYNDIELCVCGFKVFVESEEYDPVAIAAIHAIAALHIETEMHSPLQETIQSITGEPDSNEIEYQVHEFVRTERNPSIEDHPDAIVINPSEIKNWFELITNQ